MFSIIVCSNRPERARASRLHYAALFRDIDHEFILIDDARSLCEGYARGFEQARGELVVLSHDDVEFVTPDAASRLARHLAEFDVVGIAGTTRLIDGMWPSAGDPYCFLLVVYPEKDGLYSVRYAGEGPLCVPGMQALDGCFVACRRDVVERTGFDATTFDGFHLYDLDFTFRAYLNGFTLAVCRDLALIHQSLGTPDGEWQRYRERFEAKHRNRLTAGEHGDMKVVGAMMSRDEVSVMCRPEVLARSIRWH
jgi:GT2 family glycosyltransferase